MDGRRPQPFKAGTKLAERLEVEFGPFRPAASRSRMLLAYIHRSITDRVHFLDKARRAVTLQGPTTTAQRPADEAINIS
jgi:hypothetical protein